MVQYGITRSVVLPVATKPSQVPVINRGCELLKSSSIIPFGALHPQTPNIEEEIAFLIEHGIQGIKFHPEYQDFYIDSPVFFPVYEQLQAAGLIVIFHAGKDPGPFSCDHALPTALHTVLRNFPAMRIVAAHMGGWKLWQEVEERLCGKPIYFDTSAVSEYLAPNDFIRMIRKHGVERILFGTDSPWFDQGATRKWIGEMDISDSEKELIFYKNGEDLLNQVTAG